VRAPSLKDIAPVTRRIIIVNCALALLAEGLSLFGLPNPIREYFPMRLGDLLQGAFWQLFTYMWVHAELYGIMIVHLLFNMLTLFFIGRIVEPRMGAKAFWWTYLIGGLAAIFFFLAEQVLTVALNGTAVIEWDRPLVGASGAVCAVVGVFGVLLPNVQVFIMFLPFPIRAVNAVRGFAVFSLVVALAGCLPGVGTAPGLQWLFAVAHSAHLGGLLFGWWVGTQLVQGGGPVSGPPPLNFGVERMSPAEIRDALDPILEKISREGIQSLTPKEREILDRARRLFG